MMKFHKFASTSQGPKYFEKGWACQDYSGTLNFQDVQVIAVADGHGSSDCFRSEYGSKLAIDILFEQIKIFCKDNLEKFERFSETGIKKFKYDLVTEWRKAVKKHWDENLIDEKELRYKSVSEKYKARYTSENPQIVEEYLYNAYGTTLICAISIGTQILILQIGDGTCVVLQKDGEFKIPVPTAEENFLNVTTSLCEDKAELKIRHVILNCEENSPSFPVAIFLSTDGLDDCYAYYRNEEYLYKLYGVIIENMLEFGYDATETEIKNELLAGMTKKGSQDDISLAYFIVEDIKTLEATYNKIDLKYKPPKKVESPVQENLPLQENQAENISTETKITEDKNSPAPYEENQFEIIPEVKNSKIFSTETKITEQNLTSQNFSGSKILKAGEYSLTAPVSIPGTQKSD